MAQHTLRTIRDGLPRPMTLEEVAALVRSQFGFRCTAGHLSNVERGKGFLGPKLRAALAFIYGQPRATIDRAYARGCRNGTTH